MADWARTEEAERLIAKPPTSIEVLFVVFEPDLNELSAALSAVAHEAASAGIVAVRVRRNDGIAGWEEPLMGAVAKLEAANIRVALEHGDNVGFGRGVNALLAQVAAPWTLLLNQDAIPEPGSLSELASAAATAPDEVAALEMRQIPYEHPKLYDPVTLETEWVSGAAVLFRTEALRRVGGFEPRIFMYGEDVELSWRLRCAGYRLRYFPRAAVVHRTYDKPHAVKPLQALEGIYVNLCLRARYSGHRQIAQGLAMAAAEFMLPESFPGRRRGIVRAVWKFARNYRYFWRTRVGAPHFEPRFAGWGYEIRRDGAFHPFRPRSEWPFPRPLVSILVRTHRRGGFLRQALTSCLHQTWRPLEVVVVEDGSSEGEQVCAEFADRLDIRYERLEPARGRSHAGNRALALARGEWLCFLDDDDVYFADHVEVLLDAVLTQGVKGAYALSWRTATRVHDHVAPVYDEVRMERFPDEPFSRTALWHHNFMPIQSVMFHRSLHERYGGFEEDMDQLEDWNLWTRYTLEDDFIQVRKLTSKYRVPADVRMTAERQLKLDQAYQDAVRRQERMRFVASPAYVRRLAEDYVRSNALVHVGKDDIRRRLTGSGWLGRLFALRSVLRRG